VSGSGGGVRSHPRADGRWEGRYYVKGQRKSVFGRTKREAQEALRKALTNADNGIAPVPQRATVATYLEEWLDTSVRPRLRPRTAESYTDTVTRYIAPAIGKVQLAKLTPEDVSRMVARLTARGDLSPTTVRYAYAVLRIALGRALKTGRVVRNVATLADPPGKAHVEQHPLTAEQARAFLEAVASDRLGALYTVAIATGMRQGELLGLTWADVDLEAGTLAVRHTLTRGTRELADPKTERSRRVLRLGMEATTALCKHRPRQLVERVAAGRRWGIRGKDRDKEPDLVFTTRIGTAMDSRNVTQGLQTALARAGMPRQRFHDLRHAYATLMIEAGEDLVVVSKSLGHSNLATTADVYAHLTPTMQEAAAARMDGILARRKAAI
jgi:integrase